jgi:hypothetical protein
MAGSDELPAFPAIEVTDQFIDRDCMPATAALLEDDSRPPAHTDRSERVTVHAKPIAGDRPDQDALVA